MRALLEHYGAACSVLCRARKDDASLSTSSPSSTTATAHDDGDLDRDELIVIRAQRLSEQRVHELYPSTSPPLIALTLPYHRRRRRETVDACVSTSASNEDGTTASAHAVATSVPQRVTLADTARSCVAAPATGERDRPPISLLYLSNPPPMHLRHLLHLLPHRRNIIHSRARTES